MIKLVKKMKKLWQTNKLFSYLICVTITFFMLSNTSKIYADEDQISESLNVESFLEILETYLNENNIEDLNIKDMYDSLISGESIDYENILSSILGSVTVEVKEAIKSVAVLFLIIILTAILSAIKLEGSSETVAISKIVILTSISAILLKNYITILQMFKNIINVLSYLMQIVSTFLTGVLLASGKITTTGVIKPIILFASSAICVMCEYIVIPFFTLSIVINIVSKISDNLRLDKMSKLFRKSSLYIFSTIIGIFVLVLSMESEVTKSIDNIYFKTAQNVVSNVVPVVGDFLSDSLDTVLGATELIGKVGGTVSIICVLLITLIPIIKLTIIIVLYKILAALGEPLTDDNTIISFVDEFAGVYTQMLGILIGIMVLFVVSVSIIMNIISSISA